MAEPQEDLIDVGSERAQPWDGWLQRWRRHRVLQLATVVVVAAGVVAVLALQNRHNTGHRAGPSPRPSIRPGPTTASAAPYVDEEYLIAVPAQDMRAEIVRCGKACVAQSLAGPLLSREVRTFPSFRPLAGGTVTRGRTLVLQTAEGYVGQNAIAHLTVRPTRPSTPRTIAPTSDTVIHPGYRTTTLTGVRNHCRYVAVLVADTGVPPTAGARTWATTTPLVCD